MTRRVNPLSFRMIVRNNWRNHYFSKNRSQVFFVERNKKIRDFFDTLKLDISELKISCVKNVINITLFVLDPSLIIGADSNKMDQILKSLYGIIDDRSVKVRVNVVGIGSLYADAQSIANFIAGQLKKRLRTRMVMRGVQSKVMAEPRVKGMRIELRGLMDGNEMAQCKKSYLGKTSLTTIDNDIRYAETKAVTARGVIGVKVMLNMAKWSPRYREGTRPPFSPVSTKSTPSTKS